MALKAELAARGIAIYNSITLEELVIASMAVSYAKAFAETLGKNHAEGLSKAVRTRIRKHGKVREALVGPDDGTAAVLVLTSETPDEARLALLDLDVTAEDVRGQYLRWDPETETWRAGASRR